MARIQLKRAPVSTPGCLDTPGVLKHPAEFGVNPGMPRPQQRRLAQRIDRRIQGTAGDASTRALPERLRLLAGDTSGAVGRTLTQPPHGHLPEPCAGPLSPHHASPTT